MAPIILRMARAWEVKCPPCQKHMVHGQFVPTVKGAFRGPLMKQKRRVTIEIHGPETDKDMPAAAAASPTTAKATDQASPKKGALFGRKKDDDKPPIDLAKALNDDDRILIRILKPRKTTWGLGKDEESSDEEEELALQGSKSAFSESFKVDDGWTEYRRYDLDEVEEVHLEKVAWEANLGRASNKERREFRFTTAEEASEFNEEIEKLQAKLKERAAARLAAFKKTNPMTAKNTSDNAPLVVTSRGGAASKPGGILSRALGGNHQADAAKNFDLNADINLLVEIVSCTDVPVADITSTDPYIVVFLGKKEIHRTIPVSKDLNPIWTVNNGSLFILNCTAEEFFATASGISFFVKDYDMGTSNETVGKVDISQTALLAMATGERTEIDMQAMNSFKSKYKHFSPKLVLRVRKAEPSDFEFMKELNDVKKTKKLGIYADQAFLAPTVEATKLLKRESKLVDGVKKSRVKPRPDPNRDEQETKWISKVQLMEETMKPSKNWIAAGSGRCGRIYLEILKCDGLPNMDTGIRDFTDAFACVIYEDAIVNTDVINDELSPRWPHWSQRAFLFSMKHPSSQILIGILDFDSDKGLNGHDAIGRVSVDITNFRPDMDYLLTYDLYKSVLDNVRPKLGTLTIRVHIQYNSFREVVKSSLMLPALNYVNVPKRADFETAFFVCHGEENLQIFDMEAIRSYQTELEEYANLGYYIGEAVKTVFLWRGHYGVNFFGTKAKLPLHSMVAFVLASTLINNFNLYPSYCLFCIAWFLLATNEDRQRNPSPWRGTMTFAQMWYAVLVDKASAMPISDHENEAAIRVYDEEMKKREDTARAQYLAARDSAGKLGGFLSEETDAAAAEDAAASEDIATKAGGGRPTLNPLAPILLPIQMLLGGVCKSLRIVKSICNWDESIYAFVIVNACLVVGILLIWVPWSFFIRWTLRIVIWILLGPWMKLVDVYFIQKLEDENSDQSKWYKEQARLKLEAFGEARRQIMIKKETRLKLQAMKTLMFGKYVTRIPQFKEYRYPDVPLIESKAEPKKYPADFRRIIQRKQGQRLEGEMIPIWGDAIDIIKEKPKTEEPQKIDPKKVEPEGQRLVGGVTVDIVKQEPRKETPKKVEPNKDEAKKDEVKKETPKKAEESSAKKLRLKMHGIKLTNTEGFMRKSDPFFELRRKGDDNGVVTWDTVFRSETIDDNLSPNWKEASIDLSMLCGGDLDLPIQVNVFDHESSGKHVPMGRFELSVNSLISLSGGKDIVLKMKGKETGTIVISKAEVTN